MIRNNKKALMETYVHAERTKRAGDGESPAAAAGRKITPELYAEHVFYHASVVRIAIPGVIGGAYVGMP